MVEISGSGEEDEMDRQTTEDRWSKKLTWAFGSGEKKSNVCTVNDSVSHVSTMLYIPCMACFTHVGSISHLYIKNLCIHHTIDVMGWYISPVCSLSLVHITYVTYIVSITPLHTYTCPLCGFYYITHLLMGQINGYKFNSYHLHRVYILMLHFWVLDTIIPIILISLTVILWSY